MKRILLLLFVFSAFASASYAQGKFGIGFMAGEPTGISAKLKLSESSAIDGALAWSFGNYGAMQIHGDYLYNFANLAPKVSAYVGIGGRIKLTDNDKSDGTRLGVRIPVGIVYEPASTPIDLFIEAVPLFDLAPSTGFSGNAAVGIRYFFN